MNGAHDPNEKIPKPYAQLRISHSWRFGAEMRILADWHPNRCRTLRKYSRITTSMAYEPNLTNKFAVPILRMPYIMFTYQPTQLNYTILMAIYARYDQSKRAIQTRADRSNGDTIDANPLRIIYVLCLTYTIQYHPYETYSQGPWTIREMAIRV